MARDHYPDGSDGETLADADRIPNPEDEGDVEELIGEEVDAEHDVDVDALDEEDEDPEVLAIPDDEEDRP